MPNPTRLAIVLAAAASLALTACGGSDEAAPETTPTVDAAAAAEDFNNSDVRFAQGMIPHHSQAVEMASLALEPDTNAGEDVRDIAARIRSAQDPEIEQMTEWLMTWDQPVDMPEMDGMEMDGMEMDGMVASDDLEALADLSGDEFDDEWKKLMIAHHEGAIAMAETEIADGLDSDAIDLAQNIVDTQQVEIDELRR